MRSGAERQWSHRCWSDANAAANTVAENAANGTVVGITALGTDAEPGQHVTYSLSE
jgi:hypothetical protein